MTADTRLDDRGPRRRGLALVVAQAGWFVLVGLLVVTFAAGVPVRLRYLLTVAGTDGSAQIGGSLAALGQAYTLGLGQDEAAALHDLGLSQRFYAAYLVTLEVALALGCLIIAIFIFWRRSDDWFTLGVSLTLVLLGISSVSPEVPMLATVWSGWAFVYVIFLYAGSTALGMISHVHLLFLSPDGRFVPRWTMPLAAAYTGGMLGLGIYAATVAGRWGLFSVGIFLLGTAVATWAILLPLGVISQIYRYRRVSGPVQRQQTKWLVVGLAGFTMGFVVNGFFLSAGSQQSGMTRVLFNLARVPLVNLFMLLLPICLGFSILRYRLWDIDLIIRRTLIYSGLTAALVLVYFGSVVLLQALFQAVTGEGQPGFVTVVSTLAIVVVVRPLRRRVQDLIDRGFYRRKYDAAKIIAAFSATVRDETHLEKLSERLLNVVDETMQPAPVSLWLRPHTPAAPSPASPMQNQNNWL